MLKKQHSFLHAHTEALDAEYLKSRHTTLRHSRAETWHRDIHNSENNLSLYIANLMLCILQLNW